MTDIKSQEFTLRTTEESDTSSLNSLYELLTGIKRSHEQYSWEWQDGPYGPAPSWVIVDSSNEKIAAHHGVIPVPMLWNNKKILAARTENTMVNPMYRGRFLYHIYERKILNELHGKFPVIFTTSGKGGHGAVRKRLGYREIGKWRTFVLSSGWRYFAHRVFPLPDRSSDPMPTWRKYGRAIAETSDMSQIANLWSRCRRGHDSCIEREVEFLEWRFQRNPYHHYRAAIILDNNTEIGAIVWRSSFDRTNGPNILIEDFFLQEYVADVCRQVLDLFCEPWREKGFRVSMRTLISSTIFAETLSSMAPPLKDTGVTAQGSTAFLAHSTEGATESSVDNQYQITMALGQGI